MAKRLNPEATKTRASQRTPTQLRPVDMELGLAGVAPNVIRELSGIFPTFASALKELISNAYDADATRVLVSFDPELGAVTIEDNGRGMTFQEFQQNYLRLGGTSHYEPSDLTPSGRRPIGRKGIGFLAIARFCRHVEILTRSQAAMVFEDTFPLASVPKRAGTARFRLSAATQAGVLASVAEVLEVRLDGKKLRGLGRQHDQFRIDLGASASRRTDGRQLTVTSRVESSDLELHATIDYEHLLALADNHNLDSMGDFCRLRIAPADVLSSPSSTRVTVYVRDFVKRELTSPQRPGRVRNISSRRGLDRFTWQLGRSIPVDYDLGPSDLSRAGLERLAKPISAAPFTVEFSSPLLEPKEIKRPFLASMSGGTPDKNTYIKMPVTVDNAGLSAHGYLLGFPRPIFPAELRGIAVRVRGVQIGEPSFLGVGSALPTRVRPLLAQVIGEVIVDDGIDAVFSIMPGRESFYADNQEFLILREALVGDGSMHFGALGRLLDRLQEWQRVENSVTRLIGETNLRKQALLDIANAVTVLAVASPYSRNLRRLFRRSDVVAKSLARMPEYKPQTVKTIDRYTLRSEGTPADGYEVDLRHRVVTLPETSDVGSWSVHMLDRDLRVSPRKGGAEAPMCEFDLMTDTIYLNWLHPARASMGDSMFIKSVVGWRLAYLASEGDIDSMMSLIHSLLSLASHE